MPEIISELGFLTINLGCEEFTEEMFAKLMPLSKMNSGIDVLFEKPLVIRRSRNLQLHHNEMVDEIINKNIFEATYVAFRWLKENKFAGNIIFYYWARVDHLDWDIECRTYQERKKP